MRLDDAPPPVAVDPDRMHFPVTEVVARPLAERPAHDTVDAIAEWLSGPALAHGSAARAIDEFAWRMLAAGFPLLRVTVHSGTLHPQFLGMSFVWWRDVGETVQQLIAHEVRDTIAFEDNPIRRVIEANETIRRRLDVPAAAFDFSILPDLKARGGTDYLLLPVASSNARNYAVSFTTDRAGGFLEPELAQLQRMAQRLQLVADTFSQRAITRNLLSAYIGAKAGPRVLAGQIRRGTGEELTAVIWSSDLRSYTDRSDRLPGDRMIAILNALFDVQAQAIHGHGGEILKFIGDGLLAIFPIDDAVRAAEAAGNALAAANEALESVRRLADDPCMAGEPPLKIVVALHAGSVIYGNVGAANRLDFTVVGPAVNLVSRIESAAKLLDLPVVVSDDFAHAYGKPMRSLGQHRFRGLAAAHELFAP